MNIVQYLDQEWVPALGCTEPASIAYAGLMAAKGLSGEPKNIRLIVDPRIYKNCCAVGIPHSGHKTGIKWAAALGAFLKDTGARLECFREIDKNALTKASSLINSGKIDIRIDRKKERLFIDFAVSDGRDSGRCLIEGTHTNITLIEKNGKPVFKHKDKDALESYNTARKWAGLLKIEEIIKIARGLNKKARAKIQNGLKLNLNISEHGLTLFPKLFVKMMRTDPLTRIAGLVCAGVYARMWGEDYPVMSVAGSGNKGITLTVPLVLIKDEWGLKDKAVEEAMALAMIFTSKTTYELGTLSAVCGCSNAAGIGLAAAFVYLKGGGKKEISLAINNMVGNVTGMICDGAKIGCALKTMTAVDAAFRASTLAMNGIGIPFEDGIVGRDGQSSLENMGKIARDGMLHTDEEILKIMEEKLSL